MSIFKEFVIEPWKVFTFHLQAQLQSRKTTREETGKHQNVKVYSSSRKYRLTIKFIPSKAKKKKDSGRWVYMLLSLKRHCKKTGKTRNQVLNKVI